jgi:putative metallohydrolase (TIGR04338 family)
MLELPVQRRFGGLEAIETYLEWVQGLASVVGEFGHLSPVTVRARRGQTKAHYEPQTQVIAIPLDTAWAARESVVLHELAHHITMSRGLGHDEPHGPAFTITMCTLVECVQGPESALLLRTSYAALGLTTVAA